jgi:hypothetical protein
VTEWWSYGLSDFLLFSPRTYYRLFALQNAETWPWHVAILPAAAAVPWLLWATGPRPTVPRTTGPRTAGRIAAALLLAAGWLWVAWDFHHRRYATINWAATYPALAFAAQGALLLALGAVGRTFDRAGPDPTRRRVGLGLIVFAVAVQPFAGPLAGRAWSSVEIVGLAPDPTAVAGLGAALLAGRRARLALLPIPLAWCALGGATAWTMGSPDAPLLPAAALLTLGTLAMAGRAGRPARRPPHS